MNFKKNYVKFLFIVIAQFLMVELYAQNKPVVQQAKYFRKTKPMREMEQIVGVKDQSWKDGIIRNEINPKVFRETTRDPLPYGKDPAAQEYFGELMQSRDVLQNFNGVGNVNSVFPPDTDGDVGPDHYFQMINLSYAIWDKDGNKLYGPVNNSTLWNGFIGPWTGTNDGDPIVLYDEVADRWMASQFAINTSNGTYWQLIAISETGDPLGSYYQYAFEFPAFNDYPKMAVWHDAYYASFNMFGSINRGAAAAFDRSKMLVGDSTASMVLFDLTSGSDAFSMLPSDFDGTPPPNDIPNYFIYFNDDAWGYPQDQLKIYEFDVDWTTPTNSTFEEVYVLAADPFDSELCGAPRGRCIPQPNTGTKLETLSDRMMFRLQYRNFGSYEVMVTNHTVDVGSGHAGIRWYELRDDNDGNGWHIYQQGTYAPDDNHRWMGSIAMNGEGDIALGYTVSSDSVHPSIRYTGRTANAPLGEMNIDEVELIRGTSSQNSFSRWGDYSCMSIDPSDDTTFWYTQEYMDGPWKTRISSFNLDPVGAVTSDAGPDDFACEDTLFITNGSATNYNSVLWTTSGDGFVADDNRLVARYLRGNEDLENGSVVLTLTAYGYNPNQIAKDSLTVTFKYLPEIFAGNDTLICEGDDLPLNATAKDADSIYWSTSGDGVFDNDTLLNAVYTPGPEDIDNGMVELTLTGTAIAPCHADQSDVINVEIQECTGLSENMAGISEVRLIPNPNHGVFDYEIKSYASKNIELKIYTPAGNIVYSNRLSYVSSGIYKGSIDIQEVPKGVFFVEVKSENDSRIEKLIIR